MGDVTNPFIAARTAERYHLGRPYHHERTLKRLLDAVPTSAGLAVDVAAGTGLSTRALATLGYFAVGVETVPAMLAVARRSAALPMCVARRRLCRSPTEWRRWSRSAPRFTGSINLDSSQKLAGF